jgi:hypothetical protein
LLTASLTASAHPIPLSRLSCVHPYGFRLECFAVYASTLSLPPGLQDSLRDEADYSFHDGAFTHEIRAAFLGALRIRTEAQDIRTQLAKAELRLEALPRIEKEADRLREEVKTESEKRHEAEQNAAVHAQKIEGLEARLHDSQSRESETSKRLRELEAASMKARDELKSCELRRLDLERKLEDQKKEAENRLRQAGDEFERRLISEKAVALAVEKESSLAEIKERMELEQSLRRKLIEVQKGTIKAEEALKEEISRLKKAAKE